MWTSDEFSQSQKRGAGEVGARETALSRLPSADALDQDVALPRDDQQLARRVVEARARTQELIGDYVRTCARVNTELTRRREAAAERERIRAELRASVARFALLLRALGEPPERTLVLIKTAFSEAAPHQDDDNRAVLEDIVKWVVDAYYAA